VERKPVNEDDHESACASAIHDALLEEEAAAQAEIEEVVEEIEEEEEEHLTWQEERVAKLETDITEIKTTSETRHAELVSKLEALKPSIPPNLEAPPNPNPAHVNPAAILEQKEAVAPVVEQPKRKVRKI